MCFAGVVSTSHCGEPIAKEFDSGLNCEMVLYCSRTVASKHLVDMPVTAQGSLRHVWGSAAKMFMIERIEYEAQRYSYGVGRSHDRERNRRTRVRATNFGGIAERRRRRGPAL